MNTSILTSTKKNLGLDEDYTAFDDDIVMHINSVFSTLCQIGIGPETGFEISDNTATWGDFLGNDKRMNSVKTYVTLRVRLLFDPPQTSYLIAAIQKQLEELEWRLSITREGDMWTDPTPPVLDDEEDVTLILDGGTP